MSRNISTFFTLLCCVYLVTSAAHPQDSEWTGHMFKMEIMKINSKFCHIEEKMNELTVNNSNLVEELKHSKERESCCSEQKEKVKQMDREMKQMMAEMNELKLEMKKPEIDTRSKVDMMDKELREVKRANEMMEMGVTKPHSYRLWNDYYKTEPDFSWVIDDWKSLLNQTTSEMLSPVFPLKGYPFGAQANLTLKDDGYLYKSLSFKDVNKSRSELDLKIFPAVHFTFKYWNTNQPPDVVEIFRDFNYQFNSELDFGTFYYERWLIRSSEVSNDTITIDIHVEFPSRAERGVSHDGTITWAIDDFREKRTMEKESLVWFQKSPYFFTQPKGYKVQAFVWLDGFNDHKGKGLSIRIDFLTGPYDSTLTKAYKFETRVTLLHPTDPNKHITKSVDGNLNTKRWCKIEMVTNEEVEELLQEDTLYYKVQIVPF